ncbi:MAG: porin family protein [Muribaculaceae bacterium]|nr:porin family protein [Muribaculaceae bacterium]
MLMFITHAVICRNASCFRCIISNALRAFVLLLVLSAVFPAYAVERGEKSFGLKAGYESRNNSAVGGLVFQYAFSKHVRVAPQLGVVFRHEDKDALLVDVDVHFPVMLSKKACIYPLAGIAFNSWSLHGLTPETHEDVTTHKNSVGLNAGAGFEYRPKDSLKLSLELRYTLIRHYPNAQVTAGIAYIF